MYHCRWDERLETNAKGSTRLTYPGLLGGLEHPKIKTRLIDKRFSSVMCDEWENRFTSVMGDEWENWYQIVMMIYYNRIKKTRVFLHYESIKWDLKTRPIKRSSRARHLSRLDREDFLFSNPFLGEQEMDEDCQPQVFCSVFTWRMWREVDGAHPHVDQIFCVVWLLTRTWTTDPAGWRPHLRRCSAKISSCWKRCWWCVHKTSCWWGSCLAQCKWGADAA